MSNKSVYLFRDGNAQMRDLLGGKGANLAEMSNIGLPVPPGFTITTDVCMAYYAEGRRLPHDLMAEVRTALADVEKDLDKKFGDAGNPLLVSVRSGAKFSMPGMMDTILNLGLNRETLQGLIAQSGNERFAYDAFRRFIMMFSDVVLDVPKHSFEEIFNAAKKRKGITQDTELGADELKAICSEFLALVLRKTGEDLQVLSFDIHKAKDGNLQYIVGVVTNHAAKQFFNVKLEFELTRKDGKTGDTATRSMLAS